jgi:hypothetical protein
MVSLQARAGRQKLSSQKHLRGCRDADLLQRTNRGIDTRHSDVSSADNI